MQISISVIIPTLNEELTIAAALQSVLRLEPDEIFIVDGGSLDRTREVADSMGVRVLSSERGRARQMNAGAQLARGEVLLFLHADTRLPDSALADIRAAMQNHHIAGGRFDLELDSAGGMFKLIGFMISLRSRLSKIATGDQAIFVRREVFATLGGYPDIPLMEDVALSRAIKRAGEVACLKSRVITSARRWQTEGVWRTIFRMWALKSLYLAGVSPFRLKRFYGDAR
ncbi:MAG TPA: TIGR04283 family arsenosugar biosynthesis glycosyltransferase [Candidatus Binatia bacterium]|nr:TIGR04283 family arsenosugar biosynthesis glycosyltransferase [Candidatus Binatia bacterium]